MPNDSTLRAREQLSSTDEVEDEISRRELRRWQELRGLEREMPPESPQSSWEELTGFQRDVLISVRELEGEETVPTGQVILDAIEETYESSINHGRLYQNLGTLREEGFIDKVPVDGRTNAYYLTEDATTLVNDAVRRLAKACDLDATDLS